MEKRSWIFMALSGVAAVVAGLFFVFFPVGTLSVLVAIFGAFALIAGLFALVGGLRSQHNKEKWVLLVEGGLGILAGLIILIWPGISTFFVLRIIGAWAILVGIVGLINAFQVRKTESVAFISLAMGGFTVVFGGALLVAPTTSVTIISWLVGLYLVGIGLVRLAFGASLKGIERHQPA
jgi:uncharacterized membrane protein HdeD (DUF308 family)